MLQWHSNVHHDVETFCVLLVLCEGNPLVAGGFPLPEGALMQAGKLTNLAGRSENRPGRVEFCIGYISNYPVQASGKKCKFPSP